MSDSHFGRNAALLAVGGIAANQYLLRQNIEVERASYDRQVESNQRNLDSIRYHDEWVAYWQAQITDGTLTHETALELYRQYFPQGRPLYFQTRPLARLQAAEAAPAEALKRSLYWLIGSFAFCIFAIVVFNLFIV